MSTQMQFLQTLPLGLSTSSHHHHHRQSPALLFLLRPNNNNNNNTPRRNFPKLRHLSVVLAAGEETVSTSSSPEETQTQDNADPQDLQYVQQIQRVLELLRKNRDMIFSEVKLTVMIEDPRDAERRRLLGIEDQDNSPSRDDLAAALEEVHEGKIPQNRVALQILAEEMSQWPNLEVEAQKKKPSKSLYARATDTGVDPKEAARRLNIDWDTAAEVEDDDRKDENEVPAALGYGALYLVTAFPVIIGISVVLILFYNSLQ